MGSGEIQGYKRASLELLFNCFDEFRTTTSCSQASEKKPGLRREDFGRFGPILGQFGAPRLSERSIPKSVLIKFDIA